MADIIEEFNEYRSKMNEKLFADNNKIVKRILIWYHVMLRAH
jgi:hypothetical protein